MVQIYLLTGRPGTGKTTVIREAIASCSIKAGGFYTSEIRHEGIRQGFKITTIDGQSGVLSHVDIRGNYRIGKYGVNTDTLDSIGVSAIYRAIERDTLVVIDEIGKMELFSSRFMEAVLGAIASGKKILGTIMLNPHPFADEIKQRPEAKLTLVNIANRNQVLNEVRGWLQSITDENNHKTNR